MKNTMFFENNAMFLDHAGMEQMLASLDGPQLLALARNISVCLHEDWKQNLINEKGPEYQHFRPVKDPELEKRIIENADEYLSIELGGKKLYKIIEQKQPDGTVTKSAQFDLIRVPFEHLSQKWQDANLDAAKFALCLVKTCVDQNAFGESKQEAFDTFEGMSHDVHIEWMEREHSWADVRLLFPYKHLLVKSQNNNEKDKDRAHVIAVTNELTFQPNILARNRSIVVRAIDELFKDKAIQTGLTPEFMQKITSIKDLIEQQNNADFARYSTFKDAVRAEIEPILKGKTELTFADLEKCAAKYYEHWKAQAKTVDGTLPKEYDASYDDLLADDERINFKNVARLDITDLIKEMVKEQVLSEGLLEGANIVSSGDKSSELGQKIAAKNQEDVANYQALLKGNINS